MQPLWIPSSLLLATYWLCKGSYPSGFLKIVLLLTQHTPFVIIATYVAELFFFYLFSSKEVIILEINIIWLHLLCISKMLRPGDDRHISVATRDAKLSSAHELYEAVLPLGHSQWLSGILKAFYIAERCLEIAPSVSTENGTTWSSVW